MIIAKTSLIGLPPQCDECPFAETEYGALTGICLCTDNSIFEALELSKRSADCPLEEDGTVPK